MAFSPSPSSPHLYPPQTDSRSASRTGRTDEVLLRGTTGTKKLLSSWSRSRTTTPEPLAPLCTLTRSQSQLQRSTMAQQSDMVTARASSRASPYPTTVQSTERQPTLARSLMSKSSRLLSKKKSVPKLYSANVSAWDDDDDDIIVPTPSSASLLLRSPPPPMPIGIQKDSISTPFNFQHLTHTSRTHARALQGAHRENLVTEFCALRAAQKPHTELKGIRAEDIPSGLNSEAASLASPRTTSPLTSRPTTPGYARGLKTSKSVDNLRPAAIRSFSAPLAPIQPPPRKSSRKPVNLADVKIEADPVPHPVDSPTLPTPSTAMTTRSPASFRFPTNTSTPTTELSYEELPTEIAQAVTTPDDTACHMGPRVKQGSFSTLSDLPEMDESGRKSERSSQQSLRHIKSMPSVKHFSRSFSRINWGSQTSLNTTDPTLPSPDRAQDDVPIVPPRRSSMQPKSMHESWEDSVDYCYDFAMDESEVDALMMEASGDTPIAAATPAMTGSANSSAVSFHDAATPLSSAPSQPYALSPSVPSSREFPSRVTHEEQYGHRLADEDSKGPYNYSFFYSGLDSESLPPLASSPRSSRSLESGRAPLSKSSSQDSFASKHSMSEGTASGVPPARLMRAKASREQLGLMGEYDATDLPRAIDTMRQDLLRAVEAMPDEAFDDALARTMSPVPESPTRLAGRRTPDNGPSYATTAPRRTPPPRYTGGRDAPLSPFQSRSRAASASTASTMTVKPPPRGSSHRISYSLFPQYGTRT